MTHEEGVERARKWLASRCSVVVTELSHGRTETPDALGWKGLVSILVEVKTSRADFDADRRKYFRRDVSAGVGSDRYYLAPRGLLDPGELPENWGLLEPRPRGKTLRVVKKSGCFASNLQTEKSILLSVLRRIGHNAPRGVSIRCYTTETKNRATLTVAGDCCEAKPKGGV